MVAGAAMALSSVSVVTNALMLRNWVPNSPVREQEEFVAKGQRQL